MSLNFQNLTGEAKQLCERLEENVALLARGWRERVEYVTQVKYHDKETCEMKHTRDFSCTCPTKDEKRSRHVRCEGLLLQLQEYVKSKDVDRNPKAARGAPRVKKVKYMPELNGFFTLDEITCDAYSVIDRAYETAGRDRLTAAAPIHEVIGGLPYQAGEMLIDGHTDPVRDLVKATSKWVAQARRTLNMTVSDAMFEGVVCENCEGALAIAWDNSSDVRCVGTPTAPPCGHTYPMSEWMNLYEKGRK